MYRDITDITANTCAVILDDKTIITFNTNLVSTYKLLGNKYYLTVADNTHDGNYDGNTVCYTLQQLETIPSNFDFVTPVYHFMAIISAMAIFYFAYRLIIYPFFRKRL